VKKCMKMDPSVKTISKESLALMTKTTELFIARLAFKCQATAALRGGKSIKLNDFLHTVHYGGQALDFLTYDFPKSLVQATSSTNKSDASKPKKRTPQEKRRDLSDLSKELENSEETTNDKEFKENNDENILSEKKGSPGSLKKSSEKSSLPPVPVARNSIANYFVGKKRSQEAVESTEEEEQGSLDELRSDETMIEPSTGNHETEVLSFEAGEEH
jgi:hypothetical protein